MADCSEITPLLGVFEDSELEPHEMQEVARHLAHCKGCEGALSDYATLGRHLRAVAIEPPLANFARNVQHRLDEVPVPLRVRLERHFGLLTERWTAALALTSGALALGAWVLLFAPYAQRYLEQGQNASTVASAQGPTQASGREGASMVASTQGPSGPDEPEMASGAAPVGDGPQTVISRLEARTPDVAVWSEPETKTTVIWIPDAP